MSTVGAQAVGTMAPSAEALDTIPKLLLRNAAKHANRPAMRHKDFGIWQTWTWAQMRDEVRSFAIGLRKLGFERGEVVAIIGDNRPRLYATFAAVQSIGGIAVPAYQDLVADEMAYVLDHAETKFAVVQNQEQVDKLISIADRLPKLRTVIFEEERGLSTYDPARLHSFEHVQKLGREEMRSNAGAAGWWLDEIAKGKGSDVSVMLYTSGTTGRPKGVMLTHDNIVLSAQNANALRQLHPRRHDARLSADGLGRRPHLLLWPIHCRRHLRGLPGRPRDDCRGPARDRPDLVLCPAARVREPAHPDHGAHGGRGLAQEAHVPLFPGRCEPLRRADPRRPPGRRQGSPAVPARQSAGLRAATATAWASPISASPTPPARRSGPSCSASIARWAST